MKSYATEIGYFCIYWATIENQIDGLLSELTSSLKDDVAVIILANMDFRSKISSVMTLGFNRKPDEKWFSDLKSVLDTIDNEIRTERNRYVHDYWVAIGDDIYKFQRQAKVYREQSRKYAVKYGHVSQPKPYEIRTLTFRMMAAVGHLMELRDKLPPSRGTLLAKALSKNPDQD